MEIKTVKFIDPIDDEKMLSIFLLDEKGFEMNRLSFYNKKSERKIQPELEKSLNELPNFLKLVYNSGRKNEKVVFSSETVNVS